MPKPWKWWNGCWWRRCSRDIVGLINQAGGKTVGLTGRDGGMIRAQKLKMVDSKDPNIARCGPGRRHRHRPAW